MFLWAANPEELKYLMSKICRQKYNQLIRLPVGHTMYFCSKLDIEEMVLLKILKAVLSLIPNRSPVCLQV